MPTATLHRRQGGDPDSARIVEDGFRLSVFLVPPAALLARGLWGATLVWLGIIVAILGAAVAGALSAGAVATPVDASVEMKQQKIPVGPVAPMVAAKQLGTNGGGWYGPNSAVPLENPTPLSNLLETLAIILLPVAVVCMVGPFTRRRRFTALVFGAMLLMSAASTPRSSRPERTCCMNGTEPQR